MDIQELTLKRFTTFIKYIKNKGHYHYIECRKRKKTLIKLLYMFYEMTSDGMTYEASCRFISHYGNPKFYLDLRHFLLHEHYAVPRIKIPSNADVEIYLYDKNRKCTKDTIKVKTETTWFSVLSGCIYSPTGQRYSVHRIKSINDKPINLYYKIRRL